MLKNCDGRVPEDFATLSKLAGEHGESFYLIDVGRFRQNIRSLVGAFGAIDQPAMLAYSYKTNYAPLFCRIANEEGCCAEVVSKTEYDMAQRLGVRPERVIYNGPLKSFAEVETATLAGATVNIDEMSEVDAVESISRTNPKARLRVGLRCRFSLCDGHGSRFGLADGEIAAALARLRELPNCDVRGLHCHFSGHRDLASFRRRAEHLVALARHYFAGAPPEVLNLGGGFYGELPPALAEQFGDVPSYEDYAAAIAPIIKAGFPGGRTPTLVLEPGAAVVADTVSFVARIGAIKHLEDRNVAFATGSIQNVKSNMSSVRLNLKVVSDHTQKDEAMAGPTDITGYTCMEQDVIYEAYNGPLRTGDFIVISNVGAYTTVFKPPFIRPAPAMLAWEPDTNSFSVARRAEDLDDFLATYVM